AVTGTITLNSALPDLSNTTGLIDIEGPGAASLNVARSSASGTPEFRIFTIDTSTNVKIVGLTITRGSVTGANGGGIANSGTLTLQESAIENNTASPNSNGDSGEGGGIDNESSGTLTVTDSTVDNNSSGAGGGILNSGTLTVNDSTIESDSAGHFGGGIFNFG